MIFISDKDYTECVSSCQPVSTPSSSSCAGTGSQPCNRFRSSIDRELHPTCLKCRGRYCNSDNPCSVCLEWDEGHWASFRKLQVKLSVKCQKREHRIGPRVKRMS